MARARTCFRTKNAFPLPARRVNHSALLDPSFLLVLSPAPAANAAHTLLIHFTKR
jgi:hypothetical protein